MADHIAELRATTLRKRREWRQGRDTQDEELLREDYRQAKYALCYAINNAKNNSWDELLKTLDRDPWGRLYKIVRKKLKRWSLPITETLDRDFLGVITNALFPQPDVGEQVARDRKRIDEEWRENLDIDELELTEAVRKMKERNVAPGPDGIPGKTLVLAYGIIGRKIRMVLTKCLRECVFPGVWKQANLVLLHKEGKPPDTPSAYRPISLLDELSKAKTPFMR